MLNAGLDKAHRDMILGHTLKGMDVHYLSPTEESLTQAMDHYTKWLDSNLTRVASNIELISANGDQVPKSNLSN